MSFQQVHRMFQLLGTLGGHDVHNFPLEVISAESLLFQKLLGWVLYTTYCIWISVAHLIGMIF